MMGVSSRATHAIDPATGDLMMPERNRKPHLNRARDVEDACFEAVSAPRDVFSTRSRVGNSGSVFKTRITQPKTDGPVPRDFAAKTMAQGERLDVFAARNSASAARGMMSPRMAFAVLVSALAAILAFWVAGGHALVVQSGSMQQSSLVRAPLAQISSPAAVLPDPVVTSSIPVEKPKHSASGFTAPLPRPARIERAGSILMIRPASD